MLSYLFWFVAGKIQGAEAIGSASYLGSLTIIFSTIVVLDMNLGMKRALSIASFSSDIIRFKQILTSSIITVGIILILMVLIMATTNVYQLLGMDKTHIWILVALIISTTFQIIFAEAIISELNAGILVLPFLVGSLIRFPIYIALYYWVTKSDLSTIIAYASMTFLTAFVFGLYCIRKIEWRDTSAFSDLWKNSKYVIKSGLASWIPHVTYVLGMQLGIVVTVSFSGKEQGGLFYIAVGIFLVVLVIITSISRVTHTLIPRLNSKEEQGAYLSKLMKLGFMITLPMGTPVLFYSGTFLALMGTEFAAASTALSILVASMPIAIICEMTYYFFYGNGDLRAILVLGIVGNLPRIVLYILLLPLLGINGAAIAYTVGYLSQFLITIRLSKIHSLKLRYREFLIISSVPYLIGTFMIAIHMPFIVGSLIIILLSLVSYIRLGLLSEDLLKEIIYSVLPGNKAVKIYPIVSRIFRKLRTRTART